MARDVSNYSTVTNVEAEAPSQTMQAVAELGQGIIRQSQEAKIVENMSSAQLELNKLSHDFQTKYEGDPFNEQGLEDFRSERTAIMDRYGESISPLFKRDWQKSASNLTKQNDVSVQTWGYQQSGVNTKNSLSRSMQNYLNQAAVDGEAFGVSPSTTMDSFMNFVSAHPPRSQSWPDRQCCAACPP